MAIRITTMDIGGDIMSTADKGEARVSVDL